MCSVYSSSCNSMWRWQPSNVWKLANYEGWMVQRESHSTASMWLWWSKSRIGSKLGVAMAMRTHTQPYIPSTTREEVWDCQLWWNTWLTFSQHFKEHHVIDSSLSGDKIFWNITRVSVRKKKSLEFHFKMLLDTFQQDMFYVSGGIKAQE